MFEKILIANRGEIACRVIRTARTMGITTVAVYSDVDRHALHVRLADEAVPIGGRTPSESYLRGEAIIAAALSTGAQAIHPGYGFLSENPDFVEAVEAAGLTFIGPSAEAIRTMGLKGRAKEVMAQAGVPIVPGYHGADQSEETLKAEAERIGYPVLIKAVAGGGGKGMRLVQDAVAFSEQLRLAQSEAETAFGNPVVLVEKFIQNPRHIEVQVFGDGERFVHLNERDCSLQRRHQKVIEEAPAPGMTEAVRQAMGQAAVLAAAAIGYRGAGTVEFIVDGSGDLSRDGFWFMEMNTRLQVEHPVTEEITGVDLVEWQLRVAAGEALPLAQDDIRITGHAFEARLYAEDVPAGFLPATGRLSHLKFGDGRVETGVAQGDEISPYYDPMIAKVITHGPTRDIALSKMRRVLQDTQVAGTVTNISFLTALCHHTGFMKGEVDTGLIERDLEHLIQAPEPNSAQLAAAGLAALRHQGGEDFFTQSCVGFSLWTPIWHNVRLSQGEIDYEVNFAFSDGKCLMRYAGCDAELFYEGQDFCMDQKRIPRAVFVENTITVFDFPAQVFSFAEPLHHDTGQVTSGDTVVSPMPGTVRHVRVQAGDAVKQGDPLLVLEAMKMEHTLCATRDGVIDVCLAAQGDQVSAGEILIQLLPQGD